MHSKCDDWSKKINIRNLSKTRDDIMFIEVSAKKISSISDKENR